MARLATHAVQLVVHLALKLALHFAHLLADTGQRQARVAGHARALERAGAPIVPGRRG